MEVNSNFTSRPSLTHTVLSVSQSVLETHKQMQYSSWCIKQSW
eukprot:CCRYP_004856-RA/>CCRYP_004856-RA protein AED:0.41 eAED:1.00 QI:0/-1/0/1/-1/0/1/0/42